MDPWQTILLAIGGNTAVVAVLAFLGKTFLEDVVARDRKQFEIELQHKVDSTLKQLEHELEMKASDHQIRFSKLHEERAATIAELYGQAANLDVAAGDFLRKYAGADQARRRERLQHLWEVAREFRQSYSKRKIYFSQSTCRLIDGYYKTLSDATSNLALFQQYPEVFDGKDEDAEEWFKAITILNDQIPHIKRALEEDFRAILGVEDAAPISHPRSA